MRVNRRFLYLGVFLVAIGSVLVAADLADPDAAAIRDALRLWPVAIVAIGLGIALRRSQFGLPAGLLAAAVPGLLLGGGFALAPRVVPDCGVGGPPSSVITEQGTFDGPARVSVATGCGSLVVGTAPGSEWQFERSDTEGRAPIIDASTRSLSIDAGGPNWWHRVDDDRDTWRLTLPTTAIEDLSFVVNAGQGRMTLPGARIGHLGVTTNAGSTILDISNADVTSLLATVNAGMLSYRVPDADVVGSFEVNAGSLEVCAPSDLGLRVRQDGNLSGIAVNGADLTGANWQSPNYASATHHAEINVEVNLGSVEINPIGGCQ
jgi:hypothetical protein